MMGRCYNEKREKYARYGGRGIAVCLRWHSFENFVADMGERPAGATIDRINNDGNYEPGNCRWASPRDQRVNASQIRLYSHFGETKCLSDWCKQFGVKYETAIYRLDKMNMGFAQAMARKAKA